MFDGTHLRGQYGCCLIVASVQGANFQVFPIAFGIVNSKNDDAWTWFMERAHSRHTRCSQALIDIC